MRDLSLRCPGFSLVVAWGFLSLVVVRRLSSCPGACGILVPRPGIESASPALEGGWILYHWTTREVPKIIFFLKSCTMTYLIRSSFFSSNYLLSAYYIPSTVPSSEDTAKEERKTGSDLSSWSLRSKGSLHSIPLGEKDNRHINR